MLLGGWWCVVVICGALWCMRVCFAVFFALCIGLRGVMGDWSYGVKSLGVLGADARFLGSMQLMRRYYAELYTLNTSLVAEYVKRANNHHALLAALKDVNHMIQKAAKLRVGQAKARIVSACRAAIKANNIHSLFKLFKTGQA